MVLLKERLKHWMTTSFPVKINREHFKEWMTAILSVTKTDTLLQGMDGYNYSGENNNNVIKMEKIKRYSKKVFKKIECLR